MTSIPRSHHPTRSGLVAIFKSVPSANPNDPLNALASILRNKGLDMDAAVPVEVVSDRDDTNLLVPGARIENEGDTYVFFLDGLGKPASRIVNDQFAARMNGPSGTRNVSDGC